MGRNFVSLLASVFRRFDGGQQKSLHRCVQIGTDCNRIGASQERSRFQICSHFTITFDTEENPIPWWLRSPPWPAWNLRGSSWNLLIGVVSMMSVGQVRELHGLKVAYLSGCSSQRLSLEAEGKKQLCLQTNNIQALSPGTMPSS